jgi:hypothetical protein
MLRAGRALLHADRPHRGADAVRGLTADLPGSGCALDFRELKLVGGHIGYPWTDEAIAVATKHENVFIDTSAYTARRYPPALVEFMRGHGRHKVLFGTNWPMIAPAKALDGLDSLGLDDEATACFLHANARRVFALEC